MNWHKTSVLLLLTALLFCGCESSSKEISVMLEPKILTFGNVFVSKSSKQTFKIVNNSAKQYDITNVQIVGPDESEFSITSGFAGTITVESKSELEVEIEFSPQTVGEKDVAIEISHDYEKEISPKILEISAFSSIDSKLEVNPTKYHYGFIPVGNSAEKDIELKNVDFGTFKITEITFTGAGSNNYEISSGWSETPIALAHNVTHSITIKFSPNSDGDKIAQLKIDHTGNNSPVYIALTGGGGYGYIIEEFDVGMTSIRNTGINIETADYIDDVWYNFNLGFIFKFFGQDYSTIWICDNGWVSFGSDPGKPAYENFKLPYKGVPDTAIYPFWDDVEFNTSDVSDAKWVYEIQGSAPNRVFVVEWYKLNRYNTAPAMVATCQLRLYETTNVIEFHYSTEPDDWKNSSWTATIGLEDAVTGKFYQISNSPMINKCPLHNYRFVP